MIVDEDLIDRIYEAASIPELWSSVLESTAKLVDASSGALVAFSSREILGVLTTDSYRAAYDGYLPVSASLPNPRITRHLALQYPGFMTDIELSDGQDLEKDEIYTRFLYPSGLRWTSGTTITPPGSDMLGIDIARAASPFTRAEMDHLDLYRPHLARATMLAARLGLKAAQNMASALQVLGLPAAVLAASGRVIALNSLAEALEGRIQFGAYDRLHIAYPAADDLIAESVRARPSQQAARSIPLPAGNGQPPMVLHLIPVRRAATDIFNAAALLLVITTVATPRPPSPELLAGLFDLTPAEARVARGLAGGLAIEDVALQHGISAQTVRNQLRAVFAKTGTSRQSQLLSLIAGANPPAGPSGT